MLPFLKPIAQKLNTLQGTMINKIIGDDEYVINCLKEICEKKYAMPHQSLTYYGVAIDKGRAVYSDLRFPGLIMHYFLTLGEVIAFVGMIESIKRCVLR
jgi:hypothetical protein